MTQASLFGEEPGLAEITIYSDGASRGNPGEASIGVVVLDSSTDPPTPLAEISEYIGKTTNNVAEYRALIAGLEAAAPYRAHTIRVRADSKLVIEQLSGRWKVTKEHIRPLYEEARALLKPYREKDLQHVRREQNKRADALANAALDAR